MNELVRQIRDALDMSADEDLEIVTPQHERQDGVEPADPPLTTVEFDRLKTLTADELEDLGLRPWDEDRRLMLLPDEWFPHIPDGVEVTTINRVREEFDREHESGGARFGVLAYGVSPTDREDYATGDDRRCSICATNMSEMDGREQTSHLLSHAETVGVDGGDSA